MRRYGCWDCGSEVPPYHGRCAVCGWPAPAVRPRRRPWPLSLFLAIAIGVVAFGAFTAGSYASLSGDADRIDERPHRFKLPPGAFCGNSSRCEECGARWGSVSDVCEGPGEPSGGR